MHDGGLQIALPRVVFALVLMLEQLLAQRSVGFCGHQMQRSVRRIALQLLRHKGRRLGGLLVLEQRLGIIVHKLHLCGITRERRLVTRNGGGQLTRLHQHLSGHALDHRMPGGLVESGELGLRTLEVLGAQ